MKAAVLRAYNTPVEIEDLEVSSRERSHGSHELEAVRRNIRLITR